MPGIACKRRQVREIRILLHDVFEGLRPLHEVGKTQIYAFILTCSINKCMCQDIIDGKLNTSLAFMKLRV